MSTNMQGAVVLNYAAEVQKRKQAAKLERVRYRVYQNRVGELVLISGSIAKPNNMRMTEIENPSDNEYNFVCYL